MATTTQQVEAPKYNAVDVRPARFPFRPLLLGVFFVVVAVAVAVVGLG